jgi:predicted O-methyltransferase YrrM
MSEIEDNVQGKDKEHVPGGHESVDGFHSSYVAADLNYGDVLRALTVSLDPQIIVEYGILDGFSLNIFAQNARPSCNISGYDLFEKFVGNGACREVLSERFGKMSNVKIEYGDFYDAPKHLQDNSVDLLHIDIANNGDVYEFAVTHLVQKLSPSGVMILEGGTLARDEVPWMIKYEKRPIVPFLRKIAGTPTLLVTVIGTFPGLTIIRRTS